MTGEAVRQGVETLERDAQVIEEEFTELVRKASEGDKEAFRKLVDRCSPRIHGIAYQMTGNSEEARDITQEVFIRLYGTLKSYDSKREFSTWLYRITVNLAIDSLRRNRKHKHTGIEDMDENPSLQDRSPLPDRMVEQNEFKGAIDRLAEGLAENQRAVFVLRDLQGFTVEEIAGIMKNRPSTVRVHLARAREHIRRALSEHYPEYIGGNDR